MIVLFWHKNLLIQDSKGGISEAFQGREPTGSTNTTPSLEQHRAEVLSSFFPSSRLAALRRVR